MFENYKTLNEIFLQAYERFPNKIFLKYLKDEKWEGFTFKEVKEMRDFLAASLYNRGLRKGIKVGIISDNRWQWLITDLAVLSLGAVDVPRGSDSTAQEIIYILDHSEATFCFAETPAQADKILSYKEEPHFLKFLILFTGTKDELKEEVPSSIKIERFDDLIEEGKTLISSLKEELKREEDSTKEDDLATLIYTSGTTGQPKGVMLLHKNIMHNVKNLPDIMPIKSEDVWLSILPVWHIFERTVEYCLLALGCQMAYSKPTANYLLPALENIRPTCIASVPRVWEALFTGILKRTKSESKVRYYLLKFFVWIGTIFWHCKMLFLDGFPRFHKQFFLFNIFERLIGLTGCIILFIPDLIGDVLVFRKIRKVTGGRLFLPISGGGALLKHVDKFFSAVKIKIYEGYGLTETSPVIAVRTPKNYKPFTVGKPIPKVEVEIRDEEGRRLKNQHEKGIVWCRGDLVMPGYYKDPEKTSQVLTSDGWFNTGDLGRISLTGDLQLRGRAKDTIVLVGGENIEPEPIESKLKESPMIHQCMVYGQDMKRLSVLIVPDEEVLVEWAKSQKIEFNSIEELCNNEEVLKEYKRIVDSKISTHNGFKSFERIFTILLLPEAFKIGEEMTHSLKLKRNVIAEKYKNLIELKCYAEYGD